LLQTLARWIGTHTIRLDLEGHGREELGDEALDVSHTVGWFTSLYPVLFTLPQDGEGSETPTLLPLSILTASTWIKTVKEQLRSVPHKGIGYGLLRYLSDDRELREQLASAPSPQVSFNYLGQFNEGTGQEQDFVPTDPVPSETREILQAASEPSGMESGLQNPESHLLSVNGLVIGGQLHLHWSYSEQFHKQATIEALAQETLQVLRALLTYYPQQGAPAAQGTQTTTPLVAIQSVGKAYKLQAKRPFFWVHDGIGGVYWGLNLAKHLRPDRSFYGIEAPGLTINHGLFDSIEEMATSYIDKIRAVQSDGPYFLGGYCIGGSVAFEMARQLQAQGSSVALLAILEGYPVEQDTSTSTEATPVRDYAETIVRLAEDLSRSWKKKLLLPYEELSRLQLDEQIVYLLDRLKEAQVALDDTDVAQLRRQIQVAEANNSCLMRYRPKPYAGHIILFRSETAEEDPSLWTPFSDEPVEVHTVPGDHLSIVDEPHVASLALQLQQCLDKADVL
jgi:non-ribosomal peptide synthase protein (TIGR01720 family)